MTYTHDELSELLGAFALDAVDDDEREAVTAHLAQCPRCAAEVAEHREVAAALAYSGTPAPEGIWGAIAAALEETPPALTIRVPPSGAEHPGAEIPGAGSAAPGGSSTGGDVVSLASRRRTRWLPAAAAAVALVIGLVAGAVVAGDDDGSLDTASSLREVAEQVLGDPASQKVTLVSDDGAVAATAVIDEDGTGYLLGESLPALDAGSTYQLWAISDRAVVSAGVLGATPDVFVFRIEPGVSVLALTTEVAGGVVTSEQDPALVGTLS